MLATTTKNNPFFLDWTNPYSQHPSVHEASPHSNNPSQIFRLSKTAKYYQSVWNYDVREESDENYEETGNYFSCVGKSVEKIVVHDQEG